MLSDDRYRSKLDQTIASLRAWTGFIADVAQVEVQDEAEFWRLALIPSAAQACRVELLFSRAAQTYSLAVGPEAYLDEPVSDLEIYLPMLEAIAAGQVVTRRWVSLATALERAVETIIGRLDSPLWMGGRLTPVGSTIDPQECASLDQHYVPYRRD